MYAGANMGHPSRGLSWSVSVNSSGNELVREFTFVSIFRSKQKAEEMDGCPTFASAYVGRKRVFFECFYMMSRKSLRDAHQIS
jgi:hypothetical protein